MNFLSSLESSLGSRRVYFTFRNIPIVSDVCGRLVSYTTLLYTAYTAVDNRFHRPKRRLNPFISRVSCRRVNRYLTRLIRRINDVVFSETYYIAVMATAVDVYNNITLRSADGVCFISRGASAGRCVL